MKRLISAILAATIIASLGLMFVVPTPVSASEEGGYVSEKVIGRSGTEGDFTIGTSAYATAVMDIGTSVEGGGDPSVTTISVTGKTTSGATLQGSLDSMGSYGTVYVFFQYDLTGTYVSPTPTIEQTKTATGSFYQEISGLDSNTTYHYRAVVRYAVSSYKYGNDMTFTTLSEGGAPSAPTNFAISGYTDTSISLSWSKGAGATNTVIRYSTSSYPSAPTEGTALYSGSGTSTTHSDLTEGTRYFYSAWSETGGLYSSRVTVSGVPSLDTLPPPDIFQIETVQVYLSFIETGDMLVVYSVKIVWNDGMPTIYNPSDFFYVQILDEDGTVVKQDRIKLWGYTPGSLYISSTVPLLWNGAYTFKLVGTDAFSTPPSTTYTLSASNYIGTNYDNLATWVLNLATRMESSSYWDSGSLVDYASSATMLTAQGAYVFKTAIPGIEGKCPDLFTISVQPYVPELADEDLSYTEGLITNREANSGTVAWDFYEATADMLGIETENAATLVAVVVCIALTGLLVAVGLSFIPAFILGGVVYFGYTQVGVIGLGMLLVICGVLVVVWVFRHFLRESG